MLFIPGWQLFIPEWQLFIPEWQLHQMTDDKEREM